MGEVRRAGVTPEQTAPAESVAIWRQKPGLARQGGVGKRRRLRRQIFGARPALRADDAEDELNVAGADAGQDRRAALAQKTASAAYLGRRIAAIDQFADK